MPDDFPNYMHNSKLLEYLCMYAEHFHLQQYIRFETEVVSVEQQLDDGGGRWLVTIRNASDTATFASELFDAIMVCVGIHSDRNMPSFEGQDYFKGELIHSIDYRQARLPKHVKLILTFAYGCRNCLDAGNLSCRRFSVLPTVHLVYTTARDVTKPSIAAG